MTAPTNCTQCKLHLQRKQVVNGQGKFFQPKLFIVGEAPGREEDDSGQPFIGGAGKVLNQLLHGANIQRQDCFITNICRCRPPNNRVPDLDEILACTPFLTEEISKVRPSIIVALGDTASAMLTGKQVSTYRGSIVDGIGPAKGYKVLITYHPAFVMRKRDMFPVVSRDLANALKPREEIVENYIVNPSREAIKTLLDSYQLDNAEVAIDIETTGAPDDESKAALNPWAETSEIIGISFTPKAGEALHLSGGYLTLNWDLVDNFLRCYPNQIYQNNGFDRCMILVKRGYLPPICWDTLDGIHLIHAGMPKKLDFLRSIYTTMPPYKDVYKTGGKYVPGKLGPDALARLNCLDTDATWRIAQAQKAYVAKEQMQSILREDDMAIRMRTLGVLVDQERIASHYMRILPTIESYKSKFATQFGIEISSPKQLNKLLYDELKFPTYDDTGKSCIRSNASTNEKAIQAIGSALGLVYLNDEDGERFEGEVPNKEVLSDILEYRGMAKIASTYCEGVFKALDRDGLLHPQWGAAVTDTGRWSCRGTPMQGYPKDMRDTIIARPGKVFHGADFKGMQIMAAAIMAGDFELAEKMLDPDYSIHNEVLEAIRPHYPSIKKIQAKTVVFGTFFGRTPRSIAMQFHVPTKTAELWQQIFYSTRPKLRELFEVKLPKEWETLGYAVGITGRKKYCNAVTEAKNHPVQNFEAEVVKRAMHKLEEEGFTLVLQIHDQLVTEDDDLGPDGNEARHQKFESILTHVWPELFHTFPVEGSWGYRWSEV